MQTNALPKAVSRVFVALDGIGAQGLVPSQYSQYVNYLTSSGHSFSVKRGKVDISTSVDSLTFSIRKLGFLYDIPEDPVASIPQSYLGGLVNAEIQLKGENASETGHYSSIQITGGLAWASDLIGTKSQKYVVSKTDELDVNISLVGDVSVDSLAKWKVRLSSASASYTYQDKTASLELAGDIRIGRKNFGADITSLVLGYSSNSSGSWKASVGLLPTGDGIEADIEEDGVLIARVRSDSSTNTLIEVSPSLLAQYSINDDYAKQFLDGIAIDLGAADDSIKQLLDDRLSGLAIDANEINQLLDDRIAGLAIDDSTIKQFLDDRVSGLEAIDANYIKQLLDARTIGLAGTVISDITATLGRQYTDLKPSLGALINGSKRTYDIESELQRFLRLKTVDIRLISDAPTDITINSDKVDENVAIGYVIGKLETVDPDAEDAFTYSLVAGDGDDDNADFEIIDGELRIKSSPDYEVKSAYNVRIQSKDYRGLTVEEKVQLFVEDVNEAPTDLQALTPSFKENIRKNSVVSGFISTDPDAADSFTYSLVSGEGDVDNAGFELIGGSLRIKSSPDFEKKSSYSIRVQSKDLLGLTFEKQILLQVLDVNESTDSSESPDPVPPEQPAKPVDKTPEPEDQTPADSASAAANIQPTDDDGDGLREVVTAADGTSVDGNRDGIPDVQQAQVAGLRLINDGANGSDYGALVVNNDVRLQSVSLILSAADGSIPVSTRSGGTLVVNTPNGVANAFAGFLSFVVTDVTPGGSTEATINFPAGLQAGSDNAYVRFNYSTNRFEEYVDSSGNRLYSFVDSDGDGLIDAVKLTLIDGDPSWDGDGSVNGTIVDPGYLAVGQRDFIGTKRKDALTGNILGNVIRGRKNRDRILGGLGADLLIGGKDKDRYFYASADDSKADGAHDTVRFAKGDHFVFSSFDGNATKDGRQPLSFIGKHAFTGEPGELRAVRSLLEADINGDRQADFAVSLRKHFLVTQSDLIL